MSGPPRHRERSGRRPWSTQAGSGGGQGSTGVVATRGRARHAERAPAPHPLERGSAWWYVAAAEVTPDWQARTGQAGYFLARVTVAERYRGLAFQAVEPGELGYPPDQIELFCEAHLRRALGLGDGDRSPSG